MRKRALPVVLMYTCVILAMNQSGMIFWSDEETNIFFSLGEAVPEPEAPVLLVFFSLDCHVCWDDLFEMRYFIERNRIPVTLVGVTKDSPVAVDAFLRKYSFFHPVVCDQRKELYRRFKVSLEPYKVIFDNGRVLYQDDDYAEFSERLEKAKECLRDMTWR